MGAPRPCAPREAVDGLCLEQGWIAEGEGGGPFLVRSSSQRIQPPAWEEGRGWACAVVSNVLSAELDTLFSSFQFILSHTHTQKAGGIVPILQMGKGAPTELA